MSKPQAAIDLSTWSPPPRVLHPLQKTQTTANVYAEREARIRRGPHIDVKKKKKILASRMRDRISDSRVGERN